MEPKKNSEIRNSNKRPHSSCQITADEQGTPHVKRKNIQNDTPANIYSKRCRIFGMSINKFGMIWAKNYWKCSHCCERGVNTKQTMPNLNEMLTVLMNRLKFEQKLNDLKQYATVDDIAKWKRQLKDGIEDQLKQSKYESTDQFYKDVEKFLFEIIRSIGFGKNRPYHTLKKWAESTKVSMECSLLLLDLCKECFENYNKEVPGYFTYVCNLQHKVVWAKCENRPYWPAKVLKEDDNWAFVQYFGAYSIARVKSNSIIDISEQNPNKAMNDETLRILKNCTREVDRYRQNMHREHPTELNRRSENQVQTMETVNGTSECPIQVKQSLENLDQPNEIDIEFNRHHSTIMKLYEKRIHEEKKAIDAELKASRSEAERLKEEKEQLMRENKTKEATIATMKENFKSLSNNHAKILDEKNQLEKNVEEINEQLLISVATNQEKTEQLENIQNQSHRLILALENLKAELTEKIEENKQLAAKLAAVEAKKKETEVQMNKQKDIFAQAFKQFQEI